MISGKNRAQPENPRLQFRARRAFVLLARRRMARRMLYHPGRLSPLQAFGQMIIRSRHSPPPDENQVRPRRGLS